MVRRTGKDEEEAAATLGASGLGTFLRVTLPNIKWGLLYSVLLCNARALGEFGAVSVVSGHIRGVTNTMPLHVELLYNNYDYVGAFAVSALLAMLAVHPRSQTCWNGAMPMNWPRPGINSWIGKDMSLPSIPFPRNWPRPGLAPA